MWKGLYFSCVFMPILCYFTKNRRRKETKGTPLGTFLSPISCRVARNRHKKQISHDHRLSRWLAQPYKGMLLAGLKAHRNICHLQSCPTATDVAAIFSLPCAKGGGTACRDGGIVRKHSQTTPQSASLTAPLTLGSLPLRRDCSTAKAFFEPPA